MSEGFIYRPPMGPIVTLYEDSDFVAIDKTAGLLSVPGRLPQHQDSAYLRVRELYPHAKITHRLDMETSGILLFAKHRDAEVAMSKIFQARTVSKKYIARVQGEILPSGVIDVPLMTDWPNRPKQMVNFVEGKQAKTFYQRLNYDVDTDISKVELTPITGRSHQLRVHLMHIGHPIIGDGFYHPKGRNHLERMALHAQQLSFMHPFSKQPLCIISKAPF